MHRAWLHAPVRIHAYCLTALQDTIYHKDFVCLLFASCHIFMMLHKLLCCLKSLLQGKALTSRAAAAGCSIMWACSWDLSDLRKAIGCAVSGQVCALSYALSRIVSGTQCSP